MERQLLHMDDPVFAPSVSKTGKAPIAVAPAGLSCEVELFLGTSPTNKASTSGLISFTSTGSQQLISLPVTMPAAGGVAYHVYLDVYAEGYLLLAYLATEDVVIPSGSVGPITWT
jgi:hypothetical protein